MILPLTAFLILKLGMLQKMLSTRVLGFLCILVGYNIWSWSDDDVILSINSLIYCKLLKRKRLILKSQIKIIFLFCSLLRFSNKRLT